MSDPLTEMIRLLRPRAVFSKGISGAGRWAVRYSAFGHPGFCAVTEGSCRLAVDGKPPILLAKGDFVLLPGTPAFTMSSPEPGPPVHLDPKNAGAGLSEVRHGRADGPPDMRQFGGHFRFDSPDAAMLVSLLPTAIHIRGVPRLTQLVQLLGEEAGREDPGRDLILERLVEILLVEALRAAPPQETGPGLLRGLSDARVAVALRAMHADIARPWTVADLSRLAGMSRTTFFDRFARVVGTSPMDYLLGWRMAVAKEILRGGRTPLDHVAERVGYGSASTFSTAFSRQVGLAPGAFARREGRRAAGPRSTGAATGATTGAAERVGGDGA